MSEFIIRRAQIQDADSIAAFNCAMALETEGKRLIPEVIGAGVRGLMKNPHAGFYLVAEADAQVVGSLMVTTEWSDWRNGQFWWIQSVYVQPEYRRRGAYKELYQFLKDQAASKPEVCGFRLYVERENKRAQQTYAALGMEETPYLLFEELKAGVQYCEDKAD